MGDGCARDWGAGTSIGGKKMSLHEKGDQTRALTHNSDFTARFRVDFSKFANVCDWIYYIIIQGTLLVNDASYNFSEQKIAQMTDEYENS